MEEIKALIIGGMIGFILGILVWSFIAWWKK